MAECAMPVGRFSCGSGFSEFLHGLFRGNGEEKMRTEMRFKDALIKAATHSLAIPAKAGIQCNMERGTRTLQRRAARACLKRSAKRAHVVLDSGFRRNDEEGGRNDEEGGRNGGVGFIRWMPAGFWHRLAEPAPGLNRCGNPSCLRGERWKERNVGAANTVA